MLKTVIIGLRVGYRMCMGNLGNSADERKAADSGRWKSVRRAYDPKHGREYTANGQTC